MKNLANDNLFGGL